MSNKWLGAAAGGVALALLLTSCGGTGGEGEFDAGTTSVVNKSDKKGGTLKFAHQDQFDSMDPGNTYYAANWDFTRFYARTLMTYEQQPGKKGLKTVPDLAESKGKMSEGGKKWTYKLKKGLKFENGEAITSEDVKYAIARSNFAPDVLNKGPTYFSRLLDAGDYKGPYEEKDLDKFKGISTPDEQTIEFNLKKPFTEFEYLATMPQTAPVPADSDKGDQYQTQVVSSGPYKYEKKWSPGKQLNLVRNKEYDPKTDPLTRNLPDKVQFKPKQEAKDRDNQLMAGDLHVDAEGLGVNAAARSQIMRDENEKKKADNPLTGFKIYFAINPKVKPFDNKACREAILYGADKTAMQTAWGGKVGGDVATSMLPTDTPGYKKIDPYATKGNKGDAKKAEEKLKACGQDDGFSTKISYRTGRDQEKKSAEALAQSLDDLGIKAELKGYETNSYTSEQAGSPSFVHDNDLGIMAYGWGADWPTGYGYLQEIMHGDSIKKAGNSNLSELDDPKVNDLLDEASKTEEKSERERMYREVDKQAMKSATFLPVIDQKALFYRPESLTNVYKHDRYKMYDFVAMGVQSE